MAIYLKSYHALITWCNAGLFWLGFWEAGLFWFSSAVQHLFPVRGIITRINFLIIQLIEKLWYHLCIKQTDKQINMKIPFKLPVKATVFPLSGGNRQKLPPDFSVKQQFSPTATAWRFTKIKEVVTSCDPIRSRKLVNIWKSTNVCTAFLFMGHAF